LPLRLWRSERRETPAHSPRLSSESLSSAGTPLAWPCPVSKLLCVSSQNLPPALIGDGHSRRQLPHLSLLACTTASFSPSGIAVHFAASISALSLSSVPLQLALLLHRTRRGLFVTQTPSTLHHRHTQHQRPCEYSRRLDVLRTYDLADLSICALSALHCA
jgi:hypothetical protein